MREHLFGKRAPADPLFRWRGGEVSRVEGLSDAVFAFALTLLVVSLEVPSNYADLRRVILSFPAFAACFALLINVWYYHYKFFRRYGLEDFLTIVINGFLLFVVLFYVYPLKFVFTNLISPLVGLDTPGFDSATGRPLMIFFSVGFTSIFLLFVLMHLHAWRKREQLELDEVELYLTRSAIRGYLLSAGVGLLSILLALVANNALSGLVYFLMGPIHFANGWMTGRHAAALQERLPG